MFDQFAGHELIQAGHVPQQGNAGRVQIDADLVDAGFDDAIERFAQVLAVDVVLIQADADVGRIDLDQFAQGILQTPADGDGAAQRGVEVGKLFPAIGADGIDAGARFVDDDVGQVGQIGGDDVGDDLLGFAAAGAVAQGDDLHLMLDEQVLELGLGLSLAIGRRLVAGSPVAGFPIADCGLRIADWNRWPESLGG